MKALLLVALCLVTPLPRLLADQPREARQFKGVDLYSWRDSAGDWQFALLPGTNRVKTREEVRSLRYRIEGVAKLEARLSRLAEGESVVWLTNVFDGQCPDAAVVDEIIATAKSADVRLEVVRPNDRKR